MTKICKLESELEIEKRNAKVWLKLYTDALEDVENARTFIHTLDPAYQSAYSMAERVHQQHRKEKEDAQ
jgi:type II secretory pathway component PulK